jgi:hypothetical protein
LCTLFAHSLSFLFTNEACKGQVNFAALVTPKTDYLVRAAYSARRCVNQGTGDCSLGNCRDDCVGWLAETRGDY